LFVSSGAETGSNMKMHFMLSQEVVKSILPSCSQTRKNGDVLREKWLNLNEADAYQKILRRTNKAPLASGAEFQKGEGCIFTPRFHAFMACFGVKINFLSLIIKHFL